MPTSMTEVLLDNGFDFTPGVGWHLPAANDQRPAESFGGQRGVFPAFIVPQDADQR